jgi:hypothetical protein
MKSITDGNGTTHFFDVFDGKKVIGSSMVFIPLMVSLVEQVPMLVYYHGKYGTRSIENYINAMPQRDFRPSLKTKKVLLVEPWGGYDAWFGALGTPDGLATLIDQAMFIAISNGPPVRPCPVKPPPPSSLILAGFSGGGAALDAVGMVKHASYMNLLSEVWCFDCMYSREGDDWAAWAGRDENKTKKLRVRLSTDENSSYKKSPRAQGDVIRSAIKGGREPNVDVDGPVKSGHEDLPGKFIPAWL